MSRDPNHEASDIDMGVGSKPWKKAPPPPLTPAQLEAEWVQGRGKPKGLQINVRTGLWRYVP